MLGRRSLLEEGSSIVKGSSLEAPTPIVTRQSKYALVGRLLADTVGTLVDVGARDRVLSSHLPRTLRYASADASGNHDYLWDLERAIPCDDANFDVVVALDVLEHVEGIHLAIGELMRITRRKMIVSFPNMGCISHRVAFLLSGRLSGKYDLLPEHQGDRHRWLTTYRQVCQFVNRHEAVKGCAVRQYDVLSGFGRIHQLASYLPLPPSLRVYTVLFEVTKSPAPV